MCKIILFSMVLVSASFIFMACEPAGNTNTANKAANASNTTANTTTPANSAAIEADLKKMTTDMAASLMKNDIAAMEKIYSDNYMFVGPDGTVSTRAQRLDAMKSGDTKYDSINYDDISVRTNSEGTGAVVISTVTVKGKNMGKPVDGKFRVTHVWSKTKDGWRMANGQTTPITATAVTEDKKEGSDKKMEANKSTAPANK